MAHRGVTKHQNMGDWLKSPPPGRGGGGKFLTGWKKKPGHVDVFLHTKRLPMTAWQHPIPMLVPVKDKESKEETIHVWTKKFTCHETEDVLDALYFRETKGDPSSPRQHPPKRCGQCKLIEHLWLECWAWLETHDWVESKDENDKKTGKWVEKKKGKGRGLDPTRVMFRFTSEANDSENQTLHVGGICGLFGRKDPPDELIAAMKAKKISVKDSWKENCTVKAGSVMCVVDNDNPAGGVQISSETKELGEKVKEEITRVWKSMEIDIQRTPYCIRWEFDSGAQMGKMYKATAMMKIKPTDRVLKLIRGEAPDLSQIETPFNQSALRTVLERHSLIKEIPWDDLFPSKEQEAEWAKEDAAEEEESSSEDDTDGDDSLDDSDTGDDDGTDDEDEDDEEESSGDDDDAAELFECDNPKCLKPVKATDKACPHCGMKYEVQEPEPEPEPEPAPKKLRSRAEALAEKSGKKAGAAKADKPKEAPPQREPGDDSEEDDATSDDDDSIPF